MGHPILLGMGYNFFYILIGDKLTCKICCQNPNPGKDWCLTLLSVVTTKRIPPTQKLKTNLLNFWNKFYNSSSRNYYNYIDSTVQMYTVQINNVYQTWTHQNLQQTAEEISGSVAFILAVYICKFLKQTSHFITNVLVYQKFISMNLILHLV